MSPFGDCALKTGVKGIAGEEGEDIGESGKPRIGIWRHRQQVQRNQLWDTVSIHRGSPSVRGQAYSTW
ncbi:hypothetical protein ACP6JB_006740 [Aspergillus fumigatus]